MQSLRACAQAANRALRSLQKSDGHWCAELQGDSILQSEYLLMKWILSQEDATMVDGRPADTLLKIVRQLRDQQRDDGGWGQYPGSDVDVSATVKGYFCLKLFGDSPNLPHMKKARYGRIVNIASGAGLRPAASGNQAYCSAKHALVGMTKQMSVELGPFGVTVNAVAPGLVLSGPWGRQQWESYGPEGQQRFIESLHARRLGEAEDIAHPTLFFASDDSGWITGQILSADGGRS